MDLVLRLKDQHQVGHTTTIKHMLYKGMYGGKINNILNAFVMILNIFKAREKLSIIKT